ncbi:MAG: hypothetical protein J0M12_12790 [Deltaproteobacteria bacterium]|nr:hypothetical protein [Deltaproteobacteria bacterium]
MRLPEHTFSAAWLAFRHGLFYEGLIRVEFKAMSLAEQSLNRPSTAANVDQVEPSTHSKPIDADAPLDLAQLNFSESLATPASERPARVRLTYAELTSVDSTADLLQVYKDKGVTFPSETRFLRHVERDWLAACKEMGPRYGSEALSAPVPLLKVEVAGQTYGILGVVHSFLLGSRSVDAISKTVQDGTNWMHEQNLGSVFSIPDSIELKDHRVVTEMVKSRSAFEQISAAAQMQLGVLAHLIPGPNSPFEMIAENSRVDAERDGQLALGDVGLFPSLKKISAIPEQIIASGGFPPYVAIEYKLRHGLELNHCQLRSAYMAEMLRNWEVPGQKKRSCGASPCG